jgi:hypothetical protein
MNETNDAGDTFRTGHPAGYPATREEQQAFYSELLGEAQARGLKPEWAAHLFNERVGCWPTNGARGLRLEDTPAAPSDKTKHWAMSWTIRQLRRTERRAGPMSETTKAQAADDETARVEASHLTSGQMVHTASPRDMPGVVAEGETPGEAIANLAASIRHLRSAE